MRPHALSLRTREHRAANTYVVSATYEPFGLSTPTRGNAVFVSVALKKKKKFNSAPDLPRSTKRYAHAIQRYRARETPLNVS